MGSGSGFGGPGGGSGGGFVIHSNFWIRNT